METSLNGLYAAGDVAAVPMQFLSGALVFGQIAAENAVEYIHKNHFYFEVEENLCQEQVNKVLVLLREFSDNRYAEVSPNDFEYKVRRNINDYLVSPKNKYKLEKAIELMNKYRTELPDIVKVRDSHELARAVEISFIIDCAVLSAHASLARKESRWGYRHWRSDFPNTDPDWVKHIDLSLGARYPEVQITYRPVERMT
ncbi:MAG: hypothetical protein AB1420_12765 [Bacillota bacterium]